MANSTDYLDRLFEVYPMEPEEARALEAADWRRVAEAFAQGDPKALVRALLQFDLFPIKDSYVPYLRRDGTAIDRNPRTVERLGRRLSDLGLEKIQDFCSAPKETNRKIGPLFRRWVRAGALGVLLLARGGVSPQQR